MVVYGVYGHTYGVGEVGLWGYMGIRMGYMGIRMGVYERTYGVYGEISEGEQNQARVIGRVYGVYGHTNGGIWGGGNGHTYGVPS